MQDTKRKRLRFILGNVILGLAAAMLLFLERLWALLGAWSLVLWMVMAAAGVYLITRDKDGGPGDPPLQL